METRRRNQVKTLEIQHGHKNGERASDGLICGSDTDEGRICELEDRAIEITWAEKEDGEQNSAILIQM